MIIHTGNRTDIPAFYSRWFINRLKEGYVYVRNPYNYNQVTKYVLSPDVVDVFAFCTKNPGPMIPHMDLLEPYGQFWYVTITPYGKDIEPNVPDKDKVMDDFIELSKIVGVNRIGWRYDPIFIDKEHSVEWHILKFAEMARKLRGYTNICVISFIDIFLKVTKNFPKARIVSKSERLTIGQELIRIAKENGMIIKPCAEGTELQEFGADCGGCMTYEMFEKALNSKLIVPRNKNTQRKENCACYLGCDIGEYDTCMHLCKYCYANTNPELVAKNIKLHNPESPLLIGELMEGDVVRVADQKSWIDKQMSLFV